jgi:Fungal Zn(2)-Cys(6) binuclear cluster domain
MVAKKKVEADNFPKGRRKRYHKRSPWACDECRLRKKKCDGQKPCEPCKSTENSMLDRQVEGED